MRNLFLPILFLISTFAYTQNREFEFADSGLMYSDETMSQLKHIVDSLNLKFKVCDLDRTYFSPRQAKAHYISLDSGRKQAARKDIKNGIDFDTFVKKYQSTEVDKNLLMVENSYLNYHNEEIVEYSSIPIGKTRYGNRIQFSDRVEEMKSKQHPQGSWILSNYKDQVRAFYLITPLSKTALPEKYARMVQYSDCMVDTSQAIFLKDAQRDYGVNHNLSIENLSMQEKKKLLQSMRSTRVVGSCSQDDSPRVHARNIAILAAETINWEIFLRAHLNIMNDRFERASDGSYAWAARHTYLKELEELDINISDLLLGISLRINNPSENHYYGSIARIGRAMAETQDQDGMDFLLLEAIKDEKLDDYNRLIAYYLFSNYNYHLTDELRQLDNKIKIQAAIATLPAYLAKPLLEEK